MLGWYPGHMHKARRQITEALPEIDVVIEVLDARLPYSSANPMLAELTRHKPVLKILSRADLADPERTREWVAFFDAQPDTRALAITTTNARELKRIPALCHELAGQVRADRDVRVMVMGIPNVGKSTLMNALLNRRVAKVGDEPAVTKSQQTFDLGEHMTVTDTPGMMWPKIAYDADGFMLAACHAIGRNAVIDEEVAAFLGNVLLTRYGAAVVERFKLKALPADGHALVEEVARRRGCLIKGGGLDLEKAAGLLLTEFRAGMIGRISLETPESRAAMLAGTPPVASGDEGDEGGEGDDV